MSDIVINIKALDLTKGAVESALRSLRKLTTEATVGDASKNVGSAYREMVKGLTEFRQKSAQEMARIIEGRQNALRTMAAMETRFKLHLLKEMGDAEKANTQKNLRRVEILKKGIVAQLAAEKAAMKEILAAEKAAAKEKEGVGKDANNKLKAQGRERAAEEKRLARERVNAEKEAERIRLAENRIANRQVMADIRQFNREKKAEARRAAQEIIQEEQRLAARRKAIGDAIMGIGTGAVKSATRMGWSAVFSGTLIGAQASMLGSQLGGALGSIGTTLSGGVGSIADIGKKTIQVLTDVVSFAGKAATAVASLYVNVITGIGSVITSAIPVVGQAVGFAIAGFGNMISGVIRMAGDLATGAVQLVGGAVEGILKTAFTLAEKVVSGVGSVIEKVAGMVGSALGKVGEIAGETFGKVLELGIGTFETMMEKIAGFRAAMADVFTQKPEMSEKARESMIRSVESMADELPVVKTDLAKALFEIMSTQLVSSPEEGLKVLKGVARAAVAGGHEADVVDTAKAATAVMSAFKIEADDTEKTLSKLFKTAVYGRFSFKDLAEGIQNVSGIAANFQTSLDDLLTAYAIASQSMAKASVPVGVKNLILALAAPSPEAQKGMDEAGISMKGYTADELAKIEVKKQAIAQMEKEITLYEGLEHKTHKQSQALKEMKRVLKEANAQLASDERQAGKFVGVMEGVHRIMAAGLSPQNLRRVIPERRALQAFAAIASSIDKEKTIGPGIAGDTGQQVETALSIQMKQMQAHLKVLANVWENSWNRIYDFVAPIITRISDVVVGRLLKLRTVFGKLIDENTLAGMQEKIGDFFEWFINEAFDKIEWVATHWKDIEKAAGTVWKNIEIAAKAAWNTMKFIGEKLAKMFGSDAEKWGEKIASAFDDAVKGAEKLWDAVNKIADGDMEPIMGLIDSIKIAWAELADFMRAKLAEALGFLQGPLNEIVGQVQNTLTLAKHPLVTGINTIFGGATNPREAAQIRRQAQSEIPGGFEKVVPEVEKALGYKLTQEVKAELLKAMLSQAEHGVEFASYNKGDVAMGLGYRMGKWLKEEKGVSAASGLAVQTQLGHNGSMDAVFLEQALHALAQTSKTLEAYGFSGKDAQDKAFLPMFDFSKWEASLTKAQAPLVRAEVEADKARREEARQAAAAADAIIKLLGGMPITGVKGPVGAVGVPGSVGKPGGPVGSPMDEDTKDKVQEDIEHNTERTADAIEDIGPTSADPETPFIGKTPKVPYKPADVAGAIKRAVELEDDKKPAKPKKPKKMPAPDWWPDDAGWNRHHSPDESPIRRRREDHNDLVRARKAWNRRINKTAFQPFGDQGAFGFHDGPGWPTLGAPIRDAKGNILGFQEFQGPPIRRTPSKTPGTDLPAHPPMSAAQLRRQREKEAKAAAEAERVARRLARGKSIQRAGEEGLDPHGGAFLEEGPQRRAAAKKFLKTHKDASLDAKALEKTASATEDQKKAVGKMNEDLAKLVTQSEALRELQEQAAKGTATMTQAQQKALGDIAGQVAKAFGQTTVSVSQLAAMFVQFKADVDAKIKKMQDDVKRAEANKGV